MLTIPTKPTLKKYGLTLEDWQRLADQQQSVCAVCHKLPMSNRLCIDHEHVPGWRLKPPDERKQYVRGLLCYPCNRFHVGKITLEKSKGVTGYLEAFESRRPT